MMKRRFFILGILVMLLVFGMTVVGCASYMEWYYSTLPGGKEQHDRQVAEINQRQRDAQNERNQSGGNSQSGGTQSSGTSVAQQPANTDITRTYTFNVSTNGQAGAGAAATAKAEAEPRATEQFRRKNPGYEIRNVQSQDNGLGTLTVTITDHRS